MPSESRLLFEFILRRKPASNIETFDGILYDFAEETLAKDSAQAAQFVQANARRLWNYVQKANQTLIDEGYAPALRVYDQENRLLHIGSVIGKKNSKHRWATIRWIDNLNDRDYEFLGALAPMLAGASKNVVTPKGNEAGIDFISLGRVFGPLRAIHNNQENIRIVGQSKKYTGKLSVDGLRDFCTTLNHVRLRAEDTTRHLPIWFKETRGPILGWVVCHAGYQSGARDMAQNEGILLTDTIGLAEELLMKKRIGLHHSEREVVGALSEALQLFKNQQTSGANSTS